MFELIIKDGMFLIDATDKEQLRQAMDILERESKDLNIKEGYRVTRFGSVKRGKR